MAANNKDKDGNYILTTKQTLFIKAYLMNGFNATEAAKSAGYSLRTAQKIGSENLSKPLIIKEIQKEKEKLYEKLDISREDILRDLQRIKGNTETNNPTAALKPEPPAPTTIASYS
jgi:phage terminase small subunit